MLGDQDNAVIRTLASVRPLMFELITEAGIIIGLAVTKRHKLHDPLTYNLKKCRR